MLNQQRRSPHVSKGSEQPRSFAQKELVFKKQISSTNGGKSSAASPRNSQSSSCVMMKYQDKKFQQQLLKNQKMRQTTSRAGSTTKISDNIFIKQDRERQRLLKQGLVYDPITQRYRGSSFKSSQSTSGLLRANNNIFRNKRVGSTANSPTSKKEFMAG